MDDTVSLPPRFTADGTPHEGMVKIVDNETHKEGEVPLYCYQSVASLLTDLFAKDGEALVPQAGVNSGSVKIPEPEAAPVQAEMTEVVEEKAAEEAPKTRGRKAAAKGKAASSPKKRGRMSKDERESRTADLLAQDLIPEDLMPEPEPEAEAEQAGASQPEEAKPVTAKKTKASAKSADKAPATAASKKAAPATKAAATKAPEPAAAPKKATPAKKATTAKADKPTAAPKKAPAKAAKAPAKAKAGSGLQEIIEDDGFQLVLKQGERAYDIKADNGSVVGRVELMPDSQRVRVVPNDEPESEHANLTAALARIDVLVHEVA